MSQRSLINHIHKVPESFVIFIFLKYLYRQKSLKIELGIVEQVIPVWVDFAIFSDLLYSDVWLRKDNSFSYCNLDSQNEMIYLYIKSYERIQFGVHFLESSNVSSVVLFFSCPLA